MNDNQSNKILLMFGLVLLIGMLGGITYSFLTIQEQERIRMLLNMIRI